MPIAPSVNKRPSCQGPPYLVITWDTPVNINGTSMIRKIEDEYVTTNRAHEISSFQFNPIRKAFPTVI